MRVALADDSALFRRGLALLLDQAGVEVAWQARNADELLARLDLATPDVAILDIRMPPSFTEEGLAAAEQIRRRHPEVAILVLSTYAETHYAARLLAIGPRAVGYLLKDRVDDITALGEALQRLQHGEAVVDPEIVARLVARPRRDPALARFSDRERNVLALMAEGRSNAGIAQRLFLSAKTVEAHVNAVFTKLSLPASGDDNRRVLAVLSYLRAQPPNQIGNPRPP
jgi:DNA-binding NarL/FixJ family response regulator